MSMNERLRKKMAEVGPEVFKERHEALKRAKARGAEEKYRKAAEAVKKMRGENE